MNVKEIVKAKLLEDSEQRNKVLRELDDLIRAKQETYTTHSTEERSEYKNLVREYAYIKVLYNQKQTHE